jgi:hypothetical protein
MRQTTNASLPSSYPFRPSFGWIDPTVETTAGIDARGLDSAPRNRKNPATHPRIRNSTSRLSSWDMSMCSLTTRLATLSTSSSSAWFSGRLSSDAESVTRGIAVVMSSPSTGGLGGLSMSAEQRKQGELLHFDYEPPLALQAHRQSDQPAAVFALPADRPEVHPPDALEPEAGG